MYRLDLLRTFNIKSYQLVAEPKNANITAQSSLTVYSLALFSMNQNVQKYGNTFNMPSVCQDMDLVLRLRFKYLKPDLSPQQEPYFCSGFFLKAVKELGLSCFQRRF